MTRDHWTSFLTVRLVREGQAESKDTPSLLGSYRTEDDVIRFEPRFPLEPGVRYRAEFDPVQFDQVAHAISPMCVPAEGKPPTKLVAEFSIPVRPAPPTTTVVQVDPTRATLPENLLRFYIRGNRFVSGPNTLNR